MSEIPQAAVEAAALAYVETLPSKGDEERNGPKAGRRTRVRMRAVLEAAIPYLDMQGASLLEQRIAWEKANPWPEQLRRAEEAIVKALNAAGFGPQCQVTRKDRFEIAVDDIMVRVTHEPPTNQGKGPA